MVSLKNIAATAWYETITNPEYLALAKDKIYIGNLEEKIYASVILLLSKESQTHFSCIKDNLILASEEVCERNSDELFSLASAIGMLEASHLQTSDQLRNFVYRSAFSGWPQVRSKAVQCLRRLACDRDEIAMDLLKVLARNDADRFVANNARIAISEI